MRRFWTKKMSTSAEALCQNFPPEFVTYLNYTRSLKYEDGPDYEYLRRTLKDLFVREGYQRDHVYDWNILNYNKDTGLHKDKGKTEISENGAAEA